MEGADGCLGGAVTGDVLDLGPIGLVDIARYAGASGDFNPLHLDPAYARSTGSPGVFAMGMLAAGWGASTLTTRAGEPLVSFDARFRDRVWPGDRLSLAVDGDATGWSYTVSDQRERVLLTGHGQIATYGENDGSSVGEPLGPEYRWLVEEGAVRDFATAVHAPTGAVPTTFLVTAQRWRPTDDFIESLGIDARRMLHGSSSFDFPSGPLLVGEVLQVRDAVTGREQIVGRRGGSMLALDVTSTATDAAGRVRARTTMRLLELAAVPAPLAPSYVSLEPPRLLGSRDAGTGQIYFPPRALSADGSMRTCDQVVLSYTGMLHAWTEVEAVAYGQVDLPEGPRIQTRLGGGPHEIGGSYALRVARVGEHSLDWWFDRVGA